MIPTSDFGALRAFVAVAQALSFSRAAEALGVSSSALTQAVRRLEDRMGARLLNRTTRSVSLTDAGKALYDRVRPAIEELGTVMDQGYRVADRPTGTVKIHAFRIAAELFLTPMLARFARDYPGVVLDVTLDDAVTDVVAAGYDAAIRLGELTERDMVALRLGPELRQVAVASPTYLSEHGAPATPRDLLAHNCVRWRWPGHERPYAWEFYEGGRWFAVEVSGSLIASSREFGVHAAVDGVGIAFAVEEAIAPFVEDGRLVRLLEPWSEPFPGFHLCYSQQRNMAPALRAFIDALQPRTGHPVDRNGHAHGHDRPS